MLIVYTPTYTPRSSFRDKWNNYAGTLFLRRDILWAEIKVEPLYACVYVVIVCASSKMYAKNTSNHLFVFQHALRHCPKSSIQAIRCSLASNIPSNILLKTAHDSSKYPLPHPCVLLRYYSSYALFALSFTLTSRTSIQSCSSNSSPYPPAYPSPHFSRAPPSLPLH